MNTMNIKKITDWDHGHPFEYSFWPGDYIERRILEELAKRFPPVTYDFGRIWCRGTSGSTYSGGQEIFLQFKAVSDTTVQFIGERPLTDKAEFINVERFSREYFRGFLKEYSARKLSEALEPENIQFDYCRADGDSYRLRAVLYVSADCYDRHNNKNAPNWPCFDELRDGKTTIEIILQSRYYLQLRDYDLRASRAWDTFKNEINTMEDYTSQGAEIAAFESLDKLQELRRIIEKNREEKRRLIIQRENGAKV